RLCALIPFGERNFFGSLMRSGVATAGFPAPDREFYRGERVRMALLGLFAATGSFVFIEPAPYDILALLMLAGLVAAGLRFPNEIWTHVLLLVMFIVGNVIAAAASTDPLYTLRSLSIRIYLPLTWLLIVCLVLTDPRRMLSALWSG